MKSDGCSNCVTAAVLRMVVQDFIPAIFIVQIPGSTIIASDPEQSVYVTSPEDTILAKLEWYRLGDEVSDRQWRDILGVMKTRAGALDLAYLHQWADELQVADLLDRALTEAQ